MKPLPASVSPLPTAAVMIDDDDITICTAGEGPGIWMEHVLTRSGWLADHPLRQAVMMIRGLEFIVVLTAEHPGMGGWL